MITRVGRGKKCESDREVDYDITISKKKKKGKVWIQRDDENNSESKENSSRYQKKGEEEKWKEGRKTMSIRNSRKKGQDQSQ